MNLLTTLLILLTSVQALAAPLELSFTDIEKRWSAGETDASIHAQQNPRSASPSWPLVSRSSSSPNSHSHFSSSYDALTLSKRELATSTSSTALMERIRAYASKVLQSNRASKEGLIAERSLSEEEEDAAPVLRPRKVHYSWRA